MDVWTGHWLLMTGLTILAFFAFLFLTIYNWPDYVQTFKNWKTMYQLNRDPEYHDYMNTVSYLMGAFKVMNGLINQEETLKHRLNKTHSKRRRNRINDRLKKCQQARCVATSKTVEILHDYDKEKLTIVAEAYCGFRYNRRPVGAEERRDVADVTDAFIRARDQLRTEPKKINVFLQVMQENLGREVLRKRD